MIEAVGQDYIISHYKASGGPKPPSIDHQGVSDAFTEKASVVRYYYRGKWHNVISGEFAKRGRTDWAVLCSQSWLELQGAD